MARLKNRLILTAAAAFFHPHLPGEPLIFVEVALVKGLAGSAEAWTKAPLLDPRGGHRDLLFDQQLQQGLFGISFGNF
jgi:malonyl-CoA decarboxylase